MHYSTNSWWINLKILSKTLIRQSKQRCLMHYSPSYIPNNALVSFFHKKKPFCFWILPKADLPFHHNVFMTPQCVKIRCPYKERLHPQFQRFCSVLFAVSAYLRLGIIVITFHSRSTNYTVHARCACDWETSFQHWSETSLQITVALFRRIEHTMASESRSQGGILLQTFGSLKVRCWLEAMRACLMFSVLHVVDV